MPYHIDGLPITEHLLALAQRGNQPFTQRLHPGISGVLGVRLPDLRQLARRIARDATLPDYLIEAEQGTPNPEEDFMEARTLHGLVLAQYPAGDFEGYLMHLERWVVRINSWSVCDSFSLPRPKELLRQHPDALWRFFLGYLDRAEEYQVRFGIVALMQYFIDEEHIQPLLAHYLEVRHEGYYVQIALALALAECYIRFPQATLPYLQEARFVPWVHNKAIQKVCESYRIAPEAKAQLKQLRQPKG